MAIGGNTTFQKESDLNPSYSPQGNSLGVQQLLPADQLALQAAFNCLVAMALTNIPTPTAGVKLYLVYTISGPLPGALPGYIYQGSLLLNDGTNTVNTQLTFLWNNGVQASILCQYWGFYFSLGGAPVAVHGDAATLTSTPNAAAISPPTLLAPTANFTATNVFSQ